eukprot:6139708-Prymnesium_polylepis.1
MSNSSKLVRIDPGQVIKSNLSFTFKSESRDARSSGGNRGGAKGSEGEDPDLVQVRRCHNMHRRRRCGATSPADCAGAGGRPAAKRCGRGDRRRRPGLRAAAAAQSRACADASDAAAQLRATQRQAYRRPGARRQGRLDSRVVHERLS